MLPELLFEIMEFCDFRVWLTTVNVSRNCESVIKTIFSRHGVSCVKDYVEFKIDKMLAVMGYFIEPIEQSSRRNIKYLNDISLYSKYVCLCCIKRSRPFLNFMRNSFHLICHNEIPIDIDFITARNDILGKFIKTPYNSLTPFFDESTPIRQARGIIQPSPRRGVIYENGGPEEETVRKYYIYKFDEESKRKYGKFCKFDSKIFVVKNAAFECSIFGWF